MDTPSAPPRPQPFLGNAIQQLRAATDAMTRSTQDITASRTAGKEPLQVPQNTQDPDAMTIQSNFEDGKELPDPAQAESPSKVQPSLVNVPSGAGQTPAGSLASPPDSLLQDADFSPTVMANGELTKSIEADGGGSEFGGNPLRTPSSASRHSSRQPKQIDRYVPDASSASQRPASEDRRYDRRASSSGLSALTSIDGNSRRSSDVSVPAGDTPATVVGQNIKAETPTSDNRRVSRGRSSLGDPNMDEESLKLIRTLQQEDLGLRRRGARG
jgi:F-box/leucine-rich repeat protein 10/11